MYIIMLSSISISMIFMFLNHPVSLSIMIFIQVVMVSLMCGLISNMFWFSYMLFLVMIGGLLVLFMYMTNVASNEKFKPSNKVKLILMMSLMALIIMLMMDKFYCYSMTSLWTNISYMNKINIVLMKYYNFPSMSMMILTMMFLLLTMITVVKMTDTSKGALRQKF